MKTYQLPKEFAEKWVAALRDTPEEKHIVGKYTNGNGCFCGLGLAYHVAGFKFTKGNMLCKSSQRKEYSLIPMEIWRTVFEMNDVNNKTFPEIADWIEANCEFV